MKIISEQQDLTYLKWSHIRNSSGTAGTFLKSESTIGGTKRYYKLSNFDPVKGVVGHECVNEIIVGRLLTLFGIEHLDYDLINARIEIEGKEYDTYLSASYDFKNPGESKIALDDYFRVNAKPGESHYGFCVRRGWKEYIDQMIVVDFLILNRDRHGANIEVLRNARAHSLRIAPLYDHGLSLLYSCHDDEAARNFDVLGDKPCQNYIGSKSCYDNLKFVKGSKPALARRLRPADKEYLFDGLTGVLSEAFIDAIWNMIYGRYQIYDNI